jgi:hypothetical protein
VKRIEIIANRSVQEELFDLMARRKVGASYTLVPQVHGAGRSEPKQGDNVWPEYNFMLIVYCDEAEAAGIVEVVRELKRIFPDEGVRLFEAEARAVV